MIRIQSATDQCSCSLAHDKRFALFWSFKYGLDLAIRRWYPSFSNAFSEAEIPIQELVQCIGLVRLGSHLPQ